MFFLQQQVFHDISYVFWSCMWILYIIPPHLRALSELIALLGTITSIPFKGTFESMIFRTSRFGGDMFSRSLEGNLLGSRFCRRLEPWSKAPPNDKLGISPCWSDPCNDTGKRRRRRWRDLSCFQNEALYSGWLLWKICLSKTLWNIYKWFKKVMKCDLRAYCCGICWSIGSVENQAESMGREYIVNARPLSHRHFRSGSCNDLT